MSLRIQGLLLGTILSICTGCTALLPMAASSGGGTERKVERPSAADLPVGEVVRVETVGGETWRGELVSYDAATQRLRLRLSANDFREAGFRSVALDSVWILGREDRGKVRTLMAAGLLLDAAGSWLIIHSVKGLSSME